MTLSKTRFTPGWVSANCTFWRWCVLALDSYCRVKVNFNISCNFHVFSNICDKSLTLDKALASSLLVNETNFLFPAPPHQVFKQVGFAMWTQSSISSLRCQFYRPIECTERMMGIKPENISSTDIKSHSFLIDREIQSFLKLLLCLKSFLILCARVLSVNFFLIAWRIESC